VTRPTAARARTRRTRTGRSCWPTLTRETTVELAVESDDVRANGTVVLNPDPAVEGETTVTLRPRQRVRSRATRAKRPNRTSRAETTESNESSTESDDGDKPPVQRRESDDRSAAESEGGFGAQISAFVGSIVDTSASIGQDVSAFAQEHNPAANDDRPGANASADAGVDAGNGSANVGVNASANGDAGADADANVSATVGADGESDGDSASTNGSAESNTSVDANTTDGNVNASGNASVSGSAEGGLFGLL